MTDEFDKVALRKALDEIPWPACGIMDNLVVDNGLDLTSNGVQDSCTALGINLVFTPPRTPRYKATIERAGGTLNTRFIHWLPGTTLAGAVPDPKYNAREHATLTDDAFELLLEQYIRSMHNQTPRREKDGRPVRRFLAGIADWPARVPASIEEFDAACALTRDAVLRQTGLTFLGLQYQNEALGALWNRVPAGTRLTFKVNPLNLENIKVLKPVTQEVLSVDCVSDFTWPRTLSYHMAVRQHARSMGLLAGDRRDLSKAEAAFRQSIAAAVANSKKALRRMQAENFRQAHAAEEAEAQADMQAVATGSDLDDVMGQVFESRAS